MSNRYIKKNFASGLLNLQVTLGATTMTMQTGHTLPTTAGNFVCIIWNSLIYSTASSDPSLEIVIAAYSGTTNVYNITRAQESTAASVHNVGDKVLSSITAGVATADTFLIGNAEVDETSLANGKTLIADNSSGTMKLKYVTASGVGDMVRATYDPRALNKIGTEVLENGTLTPGASKYYGTDASNNKGFYDLSILPSQSGNAGKLLYTNGSSASWADSSASFAGSIISQYLGHSFTKSTSYVKGIEYTVPRSGALRVVFSLIDFNLGTSSYGRVYRNGAAVGTERSVATGGMTLTTFSEDITGWTKGDLLQVYIKTGNASYWATLCNAYIAEQSPISYVSSYGRVSAGIGDIVGSLGSSQVGVQGDTFLRTDGTTTTTTLYVKTSPTVWTAK